MTNKYTEFLWTDEWDRDFEKVKEVLSYSPIWSFPRDDEFLFDSDVSYHKIGTVIWQIYNGVERVIAYFSRVLDKVQMSLLWG